MRQATLVRTLWQALLGHFAWAFTRPGFRRFAEWVTPLALNVEEHIITQSVTAIERVADWKGMESFAEYGSWRAGYVTDALTRLVEKAPGRDCPFAQGCRYLTEPFRTKCELAVELLREQARMVKGPHLCVFDGGLALRSVVRPLVEPEDGQPRIEFLTRLRHDARLHALPPTGRREGQRGPMPKWGKKLPPPRQGGRRTRWWQKGYAFLYGRREVLWKEVVYLWRVSGPQVPVKAVVAKVEGYKKRFTLVSSALALTFLQMVELFCARFRQEDGFRDLKQRLGWEECRAWTRNPIGRTTQAQWVTMTLLRLLQFRLEAEGSTDWWTPPPWNKKKDRPSVLDVERLLRRHRPEIQQLLSEWLGDEGEAA